MSEQNGINWEELIRAEIAQSMVDAQWSAEWLPFVCALFFVIAVICSLRAFKNDDDIGWTLGALFAGFIGVVALVATCDASVRAAYGQDEWEAAIVSRIVQ